MIQDIGPPRKEGLASCLRTPRKQPAPLRAFPFFFLSPLRILDGGRVLPWALRRREYEICPRRTATGRVSSVRFHPRIEELSVHGEKPFGRVNPTTNEPNAFRLRETEFLVLTSQIRFVQPEILFPLTETRLVKSTTLFSLCWFLI